MNVSVAEDVKQSNDCFYLCTKSLHISVLSHIFIGSELNYERDTEVFLWVESWCIVGPCPQSNQV